MIQIHGYDHESVVEWDFLYNINKNIGTIRFVSINGYPIFDFVGRHVALLREMSHLN